MVTLGVTNVLTTNQLPPLNFGPPPGPPKVGDPPPIGSKVNFVVQTPRVLIRKVSSSRTNFYKATML